MPGLGGRAYVKRCHDCRRRKIKCDAKQPACERCTASGIICKGYSKSMEFVYFDGTIEQKAYSLKTSQPYYTCQTLGQASDALRATQSDLQSRGRSSSDLSNSTLAASQYKTGFLSLLQERYAPDSSLQSKSSAWMDEACRISWLNGSARLSNSLLATSLTVVGAENKDNALVTTGLQHYFKALNGLRGSLADCNVALQDQSHFDVNLLTCLICGMYEVAANRSFSRQFQHVQGVTAMLEARGPENLRSSASRKTFYEYRAIQLPACLAARKATFLGAPEWLNPPWKALEAKSSMPLQSLLDVAFQIPAVMERFDTMKPMLREDDPTMQEDSARILSVIKNDVQRLEKAIDKWESDLHGGDITMQLFIERSPGICALPDQNTVIYPFTYTFPDLQTAIALGYCEMIKIFLSQLNIDLGMCAQENNRAISNILCDIDTREYQAKAIKAADRILQSTDFFLKDHQKMLGRLGICCPFETARTLICTLSRTGTGEPEGDRLLEMKAEYCGSLRSAIMAEGLPLWEKVRLGCSEDDL